MPTSGRNRKWGQIKNGLNEKRRLRPGRGRSSISVVLIAEVKQRPILLLRCCADLVKPTVRLNEAEKLPRYRLAVPVDRRWIK